MKTNAHHWLFTIITACTALAFVATSSFADTSKSSEENNTGQTMYPGMGYGGMGPGQMGYGRMGPGNMGYGGMGPGYMGYGRMGAGMMGYGGMGYGPGMGYGGMGMMGGMGYGGMGYGMMQTLNLDKDQRSKWRALMREQRAANCKTMTAMMDVHDELAAEYDKDKPDAKAVGKLYEKMQGMQRQMFERMVEMRNKLRDMLNKDQKENFDNMYHRGMGYGGMGYGNMMNYGE
jgi:Spy/CpxP family protein refolding chaperone